MVVHLRRLILGLAVLLVGAGTHVFAQERLCPDGKRSYFGVCPDDGNNSRPVPAPASPTVTVPAPKPVAPVPYSASTALNVMVPFAPGGAIDVVARTLTQNLGPQAVVENRPGNFGITALKAFIQAPAEGVAYYVLTATTLNALKATNQSALIQQLEPVALIGNQSYVVLAPAVRPVKSMQDLVAWSRGRRLIVGTAGEGSLSELCVKQLSQAMGITVELVPYRGAGPAIVDLADGSIDMACLPLSGLSNDAIRTRVTALAVTGNASNSAYASIPSLENLGLRGVMKGEWVALVQAKRSDNGVSGAVLSQIQKVVLQPEFRSRVSQVQFNVFTVDSMNPAVAKSFISAELQQ